MYLNPNGPLYDFLITALDAVVFFLGGGKRGLNIKWIIVRLTSPIRHKHENFPVPTKLQETKKVQRLGIGVDF